MIHRAIVGLADRTGSSREAIKKYIESNFKVEVKRHLLNNALKKGLEDKSLSQHHQHSKYISIYSPSKEGASNGLPRAESNLFCNFVFPLDPP